MCFCPACLKAFKEKYGLKDSKLTPRTIKSKYKKEWSRFWVDHSAHIIKIMANALRKADQNIKVVEYTYLFRYNKPEVLEKRWRSIPKDPRINEKYLDESMLSLYHANKRKLFDLLDISVKTLKKPVSGIASLSRPNGYTTQDEALSPQQMRQKAVICAALGIKTFGLWPGNSIDGMYHIALGKACRDIWKLEDYYFSGKRVDKEIKLKPVQEAAYKDYAYTAWRKNDKILVTIFNFTGKTLEFIVGKEKKVLSVPPNGYNQKVL